MSNDQARNSIKMGAPFFVVRKILVPYVIILAAVFIYFSASILKEDDIFRSVWLDSIQSFIILLIFPIAVALFSTLTYYIRLNRYRSRFIRLNGHVCFICDYELDKNLNRCSECGTDWSTDGLNDKWTKLANSDRF